jgi:hypothetical protein
VVLKVVGDDVVGRDMSRISCEIVCKAVDGQAGANLFSRVSIAGNKWPQTDPNCCKPNSGHKQTQTAVNQILDTNRPKLL